MSELGRKRTQYFGLVAAWLVADVLTKAWAVRALAPQRLPHRVFGDIVRFTLVYNQGAAFGMHIGEWSRWIFTGLTIGALAMLAHLYRETRPADSWRTLSLGLVTAGALGNLIDRLRSAAGVVDFIDIQVAPGVRFWTFNVADIGVTCGAILLAAVLWHEERARRDVPAEVPAAPGAASAAEATPAPH